MACAGLWAKQTPRRNLVETVYGSPALGHHPRPHRCAQCRGLELGLRTESPGLSWRSATLTDAHPRDQRSLPAPPTYPALSPHNRWRGWELSPAPSLQGLRPWHREGEQLGHRCTAQKWRS